MKVALGSDHAGFRLRELLADELSGHGVEVSRHGAADESSYDYPNASDAVAAEVLAGRAGLGVLVCGTGIGVSIRANRHPGIRAALCCTEEMARLAREHNHANVLCMGARIMDPERAVSVLRAFLEGSQSEEPRHVHRVELLDAGVDRENGPVGY